MTIDNRELLENKKAIESALTYAINMIYLLAEEKVINMNVIFHNVFFALFLNVFKIREDAKFV